MHLFRLETDVGVDKQQMRRARIIQKMTNNGLARPRNQRVTGLEQVVQVPAALCKGLLQLE